MRYARPLPCDWHSPDRNANNSCDGVRRAVSEILDQFRNDGFHVFHDVPSGLPRGLVDADKPSANFEHVLIGGAGVFLFETRIFEKKKGRRNFIVVNAEGRMLINRVEQQPCPITNARAMAVRMRTMLEAGTGMVRPFVQPVIICPGWFIKDYAHRKGSDPVWTLHERSIRSWLIGKWQHNTPSDVERLAAFIESHIEQSNTAAMNAPRRRRSLFGE